MSDFKMPDSYYEPPEEYRYFWTCVKCNWESEEQEYDESGLPVYDCCPDCKGKLVVIGDYVQVG